MSSEGALARTRPPAAPAADAATLRRADWRFLLPGGLSSRAAFLGASGSPTHRSVAAVCEEVLVLDPTGPERPGSFELVVVEQATSDALRRARSLLAPGGCLYAELDRRNGGARLTSVRALGGRLAALGLRDIRVHWHFPDFDRRRCIIPFDDLRPGVRHLRRGSDKTALRLLAGVLALPGGARLLGRVLPCLSLVARAPGPEELAS